MDKNCFLIDKTGFKIFMTNTARNSTGVSLLVISKIEGL